MTLPAPAVALLFDDEALGANLREALNESGARIVYEGGLSSLTRELLETSGADVLVVDLDESADEALEQLYAVIDGASQRVVFNDAQASRGLVGWDRARWARHLALKVFEVGELDPPRPEHARGLELPEQPLPLEAAPGVDESAGAPPLTGSASVSVDGDEIPVASIDADTHMTRHAAAESESHVNAFTDTAASSVAIASDDVRTMTYTADKLAVAEPVATIDDTASWLANDDDTALLDSSEMAEFDSVPLVLNEAESYQSEAVGDESESLAAELEALLASGDLTVDEDEMTSGNGLRFSNDDAPPALHDGYFGPPLAKSEDALNDFALPETPAVEPVLPYDNEPQCAVVTPAVFQLDHLALTAMQDDVPSSFDAQANVAGVSASTEPVRAPVGWSLVEAEAEAAPAWQSTKPSPTDFGIEKISATEFLAPEVENAAAYSEPVMSLHLLSIEEAIAPKPYDAPNEIRFDDEGSELTQVILLGASASGADAVGDFLAALPADSGLFFLHTQHFGDTPVSAMVAMLASRSSVPVRLATQGARTARGEVLVVPPGQQVLLLRDGSVELVPSDTHAPKEPSIDASFTMAAGVFTQDALAIVFAGRGNDAVAGSQAIHDRGGKVWVESSSGAHLADMVSGIVAERLVSFSGSPHELSAHLIEVYR